MLVKCVINTIGDALAQGLQSYRLEERFHYDKKHKLLALGEVYLVHGILTTQSGIWVFVLNDESDDYPNQYPISFFEIVDSSIPIDWVLSSGQEFDSSARKVFTLLTYKEWANNACFYEDLVDGESQTIHVFKEISNKK